jgi:hypothetical protein
MNCELNIINGGGHCVWLEKINWFNFKLTNFLTYVWESDEVLKEGKKNEEWVLNINDIEFTEIGGKIEEKICVEG